MTTAAPPITVDIALTSACPLRCRFCTVAKTPGPELSAPQWGRILADLARLRRIGLVSIEGGEPLVRPDAGEVIAAGLARSEAVKLVTGGAVPFEALPRDLARAERFLLEVSVDGKAWKALPGRAARGRFEAPVALASLVEGGGRVLIRVAP